MTSLAAPTTTVLAEAASNPLLPNATFFVELVAFIIILVILWKYVVPPLSKAMSDRQEMIRKQVEQAKETELQLQKAQSKYDEAIEEARVNAAKIRDDARAQGAQILEELRTKAQAESDRIVERGREQLSAERDSLVRELRDDIGRLSVDLAARIVGESLANEAQQRGTIDRFLSQIDTVDGRLQSGGKQKAGSN
jgi:F-type H+-transporting ATPase subunit b